MERKLDRTDLALEKNMDRIRSMDDHLKNVQQELKYTQTRVRVCWSAADTRVHVCRVGAGL